MWQKSDGLARRLRQSQPLVPRSLLSFFISFYLLAELLTSSDITKWDWQSTTTACTLNALGYNQHYLHAAAFAPQQVFGYGLCDPARIEQGLAQIHSLINSIGTGHKIGNVLLISLSHFQLEVGVSFDLFWLPNRPITYLTDCWLLHVRRFCSTFNVSLCTILSNHIPCSARTYNSTFSWNT